MSSPEFWLTREEARSFDQRAIAGYGIPGIVLMENAGRGCAELLMRWNPTRQPTVILCGPGNNGGDGFVIARHLDFHGWPVDVQILAQHQHTRSDADTNFDILHAAGIHYTQYNPEHVADQQLAFLTQRIHRAEWVVDALFGTGLTRPMRHPYDAVVNAVHAANRPVLALDIPSGLDCDTGEPLGPTIRATHTATFVAHKKGFCHPASSEWTGTVHIVDIGVPRRLVDEYRTLRGLPAWMPCRS
ncbi:MAG: NAD(P)H-hydrate epimerase [Bacteroidales bacterium]|nr:NAD(P)H-hydrate epimerase [Bacteroidales bacterium]